MGFGHRVYKDGDPRAVYLKELCGQLAKETGNEDFEVMSDVIERVIWTEKKLPPNLDWPSARLYDYMNLPVELYTPLICAEPRVWVERAHHRATRQQPADSAACPVHWGAAAGMETVGGAIGKTVAECLQHSNARFGETRLRNAGKR